MVHYFWQSVDAILEDVPVTEKNCLMLIIFQCSKNNDSPTGVTRLKVASDMADPISLNEKKP